MRDAEINHGMKTSNAETESLTDATSPADAAHAAVTGDTHVSQTLDVLAMGVPARVVAVNGVGAVARRLMEMGVVPGAPIRVIKAAPLGDPLEIRVRNYHLAVRRDEAQTILVNRES